MIRRHFEPRSVNMVVKQIGSIERELHEPGLTGIQITVLQGARLALLWALGSESIIPRNLAKRIADVDRDSKAATP